jgi:geranylgeranyl pyrophosphate synthase
MRHTLKTVQDNIQNMERLSDSTSETAELILTIAQRRLREKIAKIVASVKSSEVLDASRDILDAMTSIIATPLDDTEAYRGRASLIDLEIRKALERKAEEIMGIQDDKEKNAQVDQCISSIRSSGGDSDSGGILLLESFISRFPLDDPLRRKMEEHLPKEAQDHANKIRSTEYARLAASLMSFVESSVSSRYSSRRGDL